MSGSPVTKRELLEEIDAAIRDHLDWLRDWHAAMLCAGPDAEPDGAPDADRLGRFGAWYVRRQHSGLVDQPAIHTLAKLHRDVREGARRLSAAAAVGQPLPTGQYIAFMDLSAELIASARRLERAFATASSELDALTGLANRRAMADALERERERAFRSERPCCLALGDLDHFKAVNDTYGHGAGDRVLSATAECFLGGVRMYDSIYRYGGEEFLFCLPDASAETARLVLERARAALAQLPIPIDGPGGPLRVTASFGVAEMAAKETVDETIARADSALYGAKQQGRDRVVVWSPATD